MLLLISISFPFRDMSCVCLCVGTRVYVCVHVSTSLESPPIMGIQGVIGHLCLIDFILFRHLKQNGLELETGSEVCLCMEKVLGTS